MKDSKGTNVVDVCFVIFPSVAVLKPMLYKQDM